MASKNLLPVAVLCSALATGMPEQHPPWTSPYLPSTVSPQTR